MSVTESVAVISDIADDDGCAASPVERAGSEGVRVRLSGWVTPEGEPPLASPVLHPLAGTPSASAVKQVLTRGASPVLLNAERANLKTMLWSIPQECRELVSSSERSLSARAARERALLPAFAPSSSVGSRRESRYTYISQYGSG